MPVYMLIYMFIFYFTYFIRMSYVILSSLSGLYIVFFVLMFFSFFINENFTKFFFFWKKEILLLQKKTYYKGPKAIIRLFPTHEGKHKQHYTVHTTQTTKSQHNILSGRTTQKQHQHTNTIKGSD